MNDYLRKYLKYIIYGFLIYIIFINILREYKIKDCLEISIFAAIVFLILDLLPKFNLDVNENFDDIKKDEDDLINEILERDLNDEDVLNLESFYYENK